MKKLFLAFFLLWSFASSAQDVTWELGVKAGPALVTQYYSIGKLDRKIVPFLRLQLGVYAKYTLNKSLALQGELLYAEKGVKIDFKSPSSDVKETYQYISMPLLINYSPLKRLMVLTGPEVSYLAQAKINGTNFGDLDTQKRVDFSWILGIGINFTEKISMDVRYFYGIRPVVDYEFQKKYNRGFQLSLSYTFLKK
jgi:hypothetical protein